MSSFGAKRKARVIKVDYDDDESNGAALPIGEGGSLQDGTCYRTVMATALLMENKADLA